MGDSHNNAALEGAEAQQQVCRVEWPACPEHGNTILFADGQKMDAAAPRP